MSKIINGVETFDWWEARTVMAFVPKSAEPVPIGRWEKLKLGDRWVLLAAQPDGLHKPLGGVERVGLAFEARDSQGIMIGKRSLRQHAMQLVEKAEANGWT